MPSHAGALIAFPWDTVDGSVKKWCPRFHAWKNITKQGHG